jgi:hypothetical protein
VRKYYNELKSTSGECKYNKAAGSSFMIYYHVERTDLGRDLTLNGIFTAKFFCGRIKASYSRTVVVEPVRNVALCLFSRNHNDFWQRFCPLIFLTWSLYRINPPM